jgi:nucleotide-binding universal stress UspA family protein
MKTILVAIDFSAITEKTIQATFSLVEGSSAKLVFLHVICPLPAVDNLLAAKADHEAVLAQKEKRARRALATMVSRARGRGFVVGSYLARGVPSIEIVSLAAELKAALIVMGSHGHGPVYDLIVGSTAQGVFQASPCPLMLVPTDSRRSEQGGPKYASPMHSAAS